jgi:methyl-accepting chemotaxis protein
MPMLDTQTVMLAFVIVTGLAVLLQTIILLAIFLTIRKTATSVSSQVDELRSAVMPVVQSTRDLLKRLTPKMESTVDDLADVASIWRDQAIETQSSVHEILQRLQQQSIRVDQMLSSVLDGVDRAGGYVAEVVSRPVRQISGVLNAVRAIMESLRNSSPRARQKGQGNSDDTFV